MSEATISLYEHYIKIASLYDEFDRVLAFIRFNLRQGNVDAMIDYIARLRDYYRFQRDIHLLTAQEARRISGKE